MISGYEALAALLVVVLRIELHIHRDFEHRVELGLHQNVLLHNIDKSVVHIFDVEPTSHCLSANTVVVN